MYIYDIISIYLAIRTFLRSLTNTGLFQCRFSDRLSNNNCVLFQNDRGVYCKIDRTKFKKNHYNPNHTGQPRFS